MANPVQVQVHFAYDDGSTIVVPIGPPVYTPGGSTPPPSGYTPSLPADVASRLNPTPIYDTQFANIQWGQVWTNKWWGGNTFNQQPLDPNNITFLSSGGVSIGVSNGGRTGCMMHTNPADANSQGFQFSYGYAEADIECPQNPAWFAWWDNGQNWPVDGENDTLEWLMGSGSHFASTNYHWGPDVNSDHPVNSGPISGNWSGRHKFGNLRTNDNSGTTARYWDGKLVKSIPAGDKGAPHYLLLSIGDRNNGGQGPVIVHRVTVWELK